MRRCGMPCFVERKIDFTRNIGVLVMPGQTQREVNGHEFARAEQLIQSDEAHAQLCRQAPQLGLSDAGLGLGRRSLVGADGVVNSVARIAKPASPGRPRSYIVNIGSVGSFIGQGSTPAYAASNGLSPLAGSM